MDFYPPDVRGFTHHTLTPEWNPEESTTRSSWEWGFVLLLEDDPKPAGQDPSRLRVIVSGQEAVFLLKMNATE